MARLRSPQYERQPARWKRPGTCSPRHSRPLKAQNWIDRRDSSTLRELFDDGFPPGEQIPRRMEIVLTAQPWPFGEVVRMTVNGLRAGDPLTDNSWSETGYRWHDYPGTYVMSQPGQARLPRLTAPRTDWDVMREEAGQGDRPGQLARHLDGVRVAAPAQPPLRLPARHHPPI